jgi:hypothetical protein
VSALHESVRADPEVQGIAIATAVVVVASILADTPQREEPDSIAFEVGRFDPIKNAKAATPPSLGPYALNGSFLAVVKVSLRPREDNRVFPPSQSLNQVIGVDPGYHADADR